MARALLAGLAGVFLATSAGATEDALPVLDPEQVEIGQAIYGQYCASCHGESGQGVPEWQEQNEQGELPPPPHGPEGHTWRHSDADLYHMVSEGWRDPFNKTEHLTMPAFGEILSPEEIQAVITFLKTLWTPDQRRFQWEESQSEPFPTTDRQNQNPTKSE